MSEITELVDKIGTPAVLAAIIAVGVKVTQMGRDIKEIRRAIFGDGKPKSGLWVRVLTLVNIINYRRKPSDSA